MNQYWICYYLLKFILADFLSFLPNVPFLFQDPILDTIFYWQFWSTMGQILGILKNVLQLNFSDVLLMIRRGLWVWGKKTTEIKYQSHHIIFRVHTINMIYHCWFDLDHLAKKVFARFLQCPYFPQPQDFIFLWLSSNYSIVCMFLHVCVCVFHIFLTIHN